MKVRSCSHKLRYEKYLELICRCLSDYIYTELTRMRIPYGEIIRVYEKAHARDSCVNDS
jgi:hypothetical protein